MAIRRPVTHPSQVPGQVDAFAVSTGTAIVPRGGGVNGGRVAAAGEEGAASLPDPKAMASGLDRLTARIRTIEHMLIDLDLGVEMRVDLGEPIDGVTLSFGKYGKEWGLWVEESASNTVTPLLKTPKRTRLDAANMLPDLVRRLTSEAVQQLEAIDRANAELSEVIEHLTATKQRLEEC